MKRLAFLILFLLPALALAQEIKIIRLPAAHKEGGKPLMQALKERKSSREFSDKELSLQNISDLLWAANGINREDYLGLRTAPTAMGMHEIDIYVAKSEGLYLYDANKHTLLPVLAGDIRALTGEQPFVKYASLNLIYVADLSKMSKVPAQDIDFYAGADAGFIAQNAYLYCASANLATVVRGWINKDTLSKRMKLRPDQRIVLAQTVGYPKN